MILARSLALAAGVAASAPALAADSAVYKKLSAEYTDCFAYYSIAVHCAPPQATRDERSGVKSLVDKAADMALVSGNAAGLSSDALADQIHYAVRQLTARMQGNCRNYPVLIAKYDDACHDLLENPDQRAEELSKQPKP